MKNDLLKKVCVYQHVRTDNREVFYIGTGSLARARNAIMRTNEWKSIFKECGQDIIIEILFDNLTLEDAHVIERALIAKYGRKDQEDGGCLVNSSTGGAGSPGVRCISNLALMVRRLDSYRRHPGTPRMSENNPNFKKSGSKHPNFGGYIHQIDVETGLCVGIYEGLNHAAQVLGASASNISRALNGILHYSYGFKWERHDTIKYPDLFVSRNISA